MLKIAITIVHNKSNAQNQAQITALLPFVEKITDGPFTDPESGASWTTFHYQLKDLAIEHEVRFFQVVPNGVTPPANLYDLDSQKVFYGPEDATKGATRFFNWGLKRSIDSGVDVACYLIDPTQLTAAKLQAGLDLLRDGTEFIDRTWVKLMTRRLLRVVGQLIEQGTLNQAITDYKTRMAEKGVTTA